MSVQEYLTTDYSPDCDYVDGALEDRNVGEHDHGRLQGLIFACLHALEKKLAIHAVIEQRVQISPARFRVPDICVLTGKTRERIVATPPFLCVEILSPEDRMQRMEDKIRDYLDMGVAYVWVVDPLSRRAWAYTRDEIKEAKDGFLRTQNPDLELNLPEVFAEM